MGNENKLVATKGRGLELLKGLEPRIKAILPQHLTPGRMLRIAENALSRNPKLLQCTERSLCAAIITASEFGLEPNTPLGQCHIIPYRDTATFVLGYPGLMELAYRSGKIDCLSAEIVRKNDEFSYALGLSPTLVHVPATGERGDMIGCYAVARFSVGEPRFVYMSKADIDEHAKRYSKAYSDPNGPWRTAYESMAKKTVLIRLCKWLPKSIDDKLARAVSVDQELEGSPAAIDVSDFIEVEAEEVHEPEQEVLV